MKRFPCTTIRENTNYPRVPPTNIPMMENRMENCKYNGKSHGKDFGDDCAMQGPIPLPIRVNDMDNEIKSTVSFGVWGSLGVQNPY